MKQDWLRREAVNRDVILFFAGWSCEGRQFENLFDFAGFDILMISDYRSLEPIRVDFRGYDSVVVLGWSFGVFVASNIDRWLIDIDSKVEFRAKNRCNIAINGTPRPVDDQYGIPVKAFKLTLASISKGGIVKFNSRISKGVEDSFVPTTRDIDSLVDELNMLYQLSESSQEGCCYVSDDDYNQTGELYNDNKKKSELEWSYSMISNKDLIFPPQNQSNFWNKKSTFASILIDVPHFPFIDECFDKLREILKIDR